MKKTIISVAVLLIIAAVCTPFINGIVMEKVITQSVQNLNAMYADSGSDIRLQITNYDRGFASSEIEWKIDLGNMAALYGVEEILLLDHAKHGLTGMVSTTTLILCTRPHIKAHKLRAGSG